jgi:hypothetical protein
VPEQQPGTRDSSIYVNYPAANKFRGDWVTVQPQGGRRVELEDPARPAADPVKRAAVEACERILSWFSNSITGDFLTMIDEIKEEKRQHDIADCVLQGVSYLFKYHIQKLGSSSQRAKTSLTLGVSNPTNATEELLAMPRVGRKKATRAAGKRSRATKRKQVEAADAEDADNDPIGDDE